MTDNVECDYCGSETLAYKMRSDRGPVNRCIPCLAIEQGQIRGWESFQRYDEDLQESTIRSNKAYMTILGRIRQDEPILKRDEDSIGTIKESVRQSILNLMGAEAYYPPSEIENAADGELREPSEATLGDYSDSGTKEDDLVDGGSNE